MIQDKLLRFCFNNVHINLQHASCVYCPTSVERFDYSSCVLRLTCEIIVIGGEFHGFSFIRKMHRTSLETSTVVSSVSFRAANGLVRFVSRK